MVKKCLTPLKNSLINTETKTCDTPVLTVATFSSSHVNTPRWQPEITFVFTVIASSSSVQNAFSNFVKYCFSVQLQLILLIRDQVQLCAFIYIARTESMAIA